MYVPLFFLHECIKVLSLQEHWEGRAPKHACNCQILASICQVSLHTHSCCRLLHQRNRLLHSHYGMEYFYLNWLTPWLRLWVMSQAETTFNLAAPLRGKRSFYELRLLNCFFVSTNLCFWWIFGTIFQDTIQSCLNLASFGSKNLQSCFSLKMTFLTQNDNLFHSGLFWLKQDRRGSQSHTARLTVFQENSVFRET